jgi:hypothetical protein
MKLRAHTLAASDDAAHVLPCPRSPLPPAFKSDRQCTLFGLPSSFELFSYIMSEDALKRNDDQIASLEEAILKCEVQLQKAKRQCDALSASVVGAHSDKHPQVIDFLLASSSERLTCSCRFKCSSFSVLDEKKSYFSKKSGSCATRNFCF